VTCDRTGDGYGQMSVEGELAHDLPFTKIHISGGLRGSGLAEVEEAKFLSHSNEGEASPSDSRCVGFGHGQGEGGRHRSIHRVSALPQDFDSGPRRLGMRRGDHPSFASRWKRCRRQRETKKYK